jgi:hypothetical protein
MTENTILLMIGLFLFCLVAVVGEICAKKFGWK